MRNFLVLFLVAILVANPIMGMAAQVTLAWDPNNPTPEGYRMFQRIEGESYDYNAPVWTGAENTCTIDNVADNTTYYFVVRAFAGVETSGDSNEVSYRNDVPGNTGPTASAAVSEPEIYPSGSVTVDGSGSIDPEDGSNLTYLWEYKFGPPVTIGSPTSAVSIVTPTSAQTGTTVLWFWVYDSAGAYMRLTVTFAIAPEPEPEPVAPTACATVIDYLGVVQSSIAEVKKNSVITLDGDCSLGGETFSWVKTQGTGGAFIGSTTEDTVQFQTGTIATIYKISYMVTNAAGSSVYILTLKNFR